jgi:hypothetical protein
MLTPRTCPAGVSLLTQLFYALVFVARYTDLFSESYRWNYFFKVFYLLSSFYTIAIMRFIYPRTREREVAWKLSALILAGCLVLSPFVMLIFDDKAYWSFQEVQLPPPASPLPTPTGSLSNAVFHQL